MGPGDKPRDDTPVASESVGTLAYLSPPLLPTGNLPSHRVRYVIDHIIDLMEDDGQPIALIEVIPRPSHLLIENVAVLPDWHGHGVGGLLLGRAETIARSIGLMNPVSCVALSQA